MPIISGSGGGGGGGSLARISDTTLAAPAANIDLQNISQGAIHLFLVTYLKTDNAGFTQATAHFNNDAGANYYSEEIQGASAAATTVEQIATTTPLYLPVGSAATALKFGAAMAMIPNYTDTTNHKTLVALSFVSDAVATGNQIVRIAGFTWANAAAVSRVTILPSAGNFVAGSRVTLYGLS